MRCMLILAGLIITGSMLTGCSGGDRSTTELEERLARAERELAALRTQESPRASGAATPVAPGAARSTAPAPRVSVPALEPYDAGVFSIRKPRNWEIITAGQCSTLAFLIRDQSRPLRQVFYFGEVGPFYMSEQQKQIDYNYMNMGGYPIQYIEMPVISPLTPEAFIQQFHLIANTSIARQFMPQCPRLEQIQVISSTPQSSGFAIQGAQTSLVRALFTRDGQVGEGLFLVAVAPFMAFMNGPGGGTGVAMSFTGITAPQGEFSTLEPMLSACVASFNLSQAYVQNCLQMQQQQYAGIMKAGETLRETSDMIMSGWQQRNKPDDIIAAKRSDAILDKERLYNPDTGEVYEFKNGFYDDYRLNPQRYEQSNLQPLPDNNHELWNAPTLDGYQHLRAF
ncbi:MAG: hypothetical protein EOM20_05625 [Spartobacteria bacterium]|nr:hypothetical protein [Spartobacteria bacterium]